MKIFKPNKITPVADSKELLKQVESKDAKFRLLQTTFIVLVLVSLIGLILSTYQLSSENHQLLDNQNRMIQQTNQLTKVLQSDVNDLKANNNMQLQDLIVHLDCIANFFASPNHNNATLQGCAIIPNPSASGGSTSPTKSTVTPVSPTPLPTALPQNNHSTQNGNSLKNMLCKLLDVCKKN